MKTITITKIFAFTLLFLGCVKNKDSFNVEIIQPDTIALPRRGSATLEKQETVEQLNQSVRTIKHYLAYLPKDYAADTKKKWPLVIFLHGKGEIGNDLDKVKYVALPALMMRNDTDYPFVMISPQLEVEENWDIGDLNKLLAEVKKYYAIDEKQIIITGMSLGGAGTWNWIAANPDLFAAAIPICGWADDTKACVVNKLPIWAFHGDEDPTVNVQTSIVMVNAIKACNGNPKLTIYYGVGHDSWTQTYNNREVIDWMLAQRKK